MGRYPESLGTSTQPGPAGATVTETACPAVPQFSGLGVKASAAAWERVNGFPAEVQSHSCVSRWLPCSLAAVHTHPPVPLASQPASSHYSVHTGPGIQGAAGGDLLDSLTPLPFQPLLGPGLSWGQVSGGGGHSLHSQTHLGFVLSGGPVPQMTWVRLKKGPGPSWLVEVAQGGVGWGVGTMAFPKAQPSLGQPWSPDAEAHWGLRAPSHLSVLSATALSCPHRSSRGRGTGAPQTFC